MKIETFLLLICKVLASGSDCADTTKNYLNKRTITSTSA